MEIVKRTKSLELLTAHGPAQLTVEALWMGDRPDEDVHVTPNELMALAAAGHLGTRKRYVVRYPV